MNEFKVTSEFEPRGDQIKAIEKLSRGINENLRYQTLLGVTGSGKTYTMAKVIEQVQKPTLILAHNKTLAAQLYSEFKTFFQDNSVEYFVSYYDYYQPEAYVPQSDLYIEKDSSVNDEIDKLRHSATAALFERKDVIIVASVSCIYGLGSPIDYEDLVVSLRPGMEKDRDEIIRKLVDIQYARNDISFTRGTFRVRGDILEIFPAASSDQAVRIEFFGDEIDRISEIDVITGEIKGTRSHISIFPASHYATTEDNLKRAIDSIRKELNDRYDQLIEENKLVEAQRILQRTNYDMEMLKEMGFCNGIENYSRHITGLPPGSPPFTLIDYFPEDFLLIVDESHVTIPQVRGMYAGDRSRKQNLVDFGFRLPSALDNRPLNFEEFEKKINQMIFTTATPGPYENEKSQNLVEQIIRPTGLVDPEIFVRPAEHQIDDLISEINAKIDKGQRVLVTTLTKKMSEDLSDYITSVGIKAKYLHSDIDTLERIKIIRQLRLGEFDVLIGINLLREGLDIPEVGLIGILDADKEGFLRSETALIQTIGRAARNVDGKVLMYGDKITPSMRKAIDETERRRKIQSEYNKEHGITPMSIVKKIHEVIEATKAAEDEAAYQTTKEVLEFGDRSIEELQEEMMLAAESLEFEKAAKIRDQIVKLQNEKIRRKEK